ncbi:four helix bundle protein [Phormidium tenue]|uniref:four helix bundle protein n=1 Tax=Phormidium tenue TaxID=126344 RepID=UPI000A02A18F|nr:four helix bundle protein [Phormidium tenue]MBD2232804.1 four helix bundle protein [Phormidium tenue FACHB-1052]
MICPPSPPILGGTRRLQSPPILGGWGADAVTVDFTDSFLNSATPDIFEVSKRFPVEERYSLTDQIRRSSRSVCANLGEAWRKRRYQAAFVAKISDCQAEATETQIWLEFAVKCQYLDAESGRNLYRNYDQVLGQLVNMIKNASTWTIQ